MTTIGNRRNLIPSIDFHYFSDARCSLSKVTVASVCLTNPKICRIMCWRRCHHSPICFTCSLKIYVIDSIPKSVVNLPMMLPHSNLYQALETTSIQSEIFTKDQTLKPSNECACVCEGEGSTEHDGCSALRVKGSCSGG